MFPGKPGKIVGMLSRIQQVARNHRVESDAFKLHPVFLQDDPVALEIVPDLADFRSAEEGAQDLQQVTDR